MGTVEIRDQNFGKTFYVVNLGDTIEKIAIKFNCSCECIKKANCIDTNFKVVAGDILIIPEGENCNRLYIVKRDDSLEKIANEFKVRGENILRLNNFKYEYLLLTGMTIQIPDN